MLDSGYVFKVDIECKKKNQDKFWFLVWTTGKMELLCIEWRRIGFEGRSRVLFQTCGNQVEISCTELNILVWNLGERTGLGIYIYLGIIDI